MGVPGLFSHLRKYNKKNDIQSTIKSQLHNASEDIHLYLDFNGAIYQALKTEIKTEETFILHILEYLDNLVKLFGQTSIFAQNDVYVESVISESDVSVDLDAEHLSNITNASNSNTNTMTTNPQLSTACKVRKLFIAIDGVPPRAKIEQQRQRRFHSICRKQKTAAIDSRYGDQYDNSKQNTYIDTNMITPGTTFMEKLRIGIRQHIDTKSLYRDMEVIFNDWSNPGEGEHKIFKYLSANQPQPNVKTIIYGLDGDLIMLSLASQIQNIFLIREAYEYGQYAFEHEGYPYLFLDVDCLKSSLVIETSRKRIGSTAHMPEHHIFRFIDDYVVLMMLLGNDFMPKIHWISIKNNGHEILLSQYFQVQNGISQVDMETDGGWLYNRTTGQINLAFLQEIFARLARQEDSLARKFVDDRVRKHIPIPSNCTERERQQLMMDYLPMQYLNIEASIRIGEPKWRGRYYRTCMDMPGTPENISQVCEAYIRTLIWNANYYVGRCQSWEWFYPYDYAPTLADVYYFIKDMKSLVPVFKWPETKPMDSQVLLFMVLPVASSGLMATAVGTRLTDTYTTDPLLKVYFPASYPINLALHSKYYECSPRIPRMPIKFAIDFVKASGLTAKEVSRNEPAGIQIWSRSKAS
jgi:5'-3' exonuclease